MLTKIFVLSGLLVLLGVGTAYAGPHWEIAGSGCVPSEDSPGYNMANNGINFAGTQTGDIHLTCPVTVPDGTLLENFFLEYDNDGGAAYYVQATLRYSESGSVTNVCTVSSNAITYDDNECDFTNFTMDTDIAHLFFYVRIHRDTGATTYNPKFYGLRLY